MTTAHAQRKGLILGGVKSGKSNLAEKLASEHALSMGTNVTLIATATADDEEMALRIARHKRERNKQWRLVEEPLQLGDALSRADQNNTQTADAGCIVIDCLTLWLTNLLMRSDTQYLHTEIEKFHASALNCTSRLIVVSNETNMGITPMGELSRQFCDETGLLHQRLGREFDDVVMMIAGIPLTVKGTI